ncbi:MAG: hypothetical protein IJQ83_07510 [Bacteroidales bacterium]|nr:hypothetical protein [Bacteroidales bacterium]
MQHELDCMGHSLRRYMNDTKCTLEVTGNDNQDVELCLLHNPFVTDLPESIKRHYDQILCLPGENQLVKVNGNMPTLEETIWLLNNLVEVHKISITSPTARLKELDLELKLSLCSPTLNSMGGIDTLNFNQIAKFESPSEAYIDLTEEPCDFSIPRIFMSINVKAGSLFNLSFIGHLKDTANPLSFMQKSSPVPQFCQSCGAPLHDGKCDYCGAGDRCSGTMLSSQKKSDYNTMEKEKQRRRFGRAEIILIIQLVTIFSMTAIALILTC